jgi:hypothetical protein
VNTNKLFITQLPQPTVHDRSREVLHG